jgi:hypothetical protein
LQKNDLLPQPIITPTTKAKQGQPASVWVLGDYGPRPPSPEWVAWPNAGFVPYSLAFDRWSFSLVGADFDAATVTMTHDGGNVSLAIVHPTLSSPQASFGDPTIVWEPTGIASGAPNDDETYEVTIAGIAGAPQTSYSYDVTLMNPNDAGLPLGLSGSATPTVGVPNPYSFPASDATGGYTFRARTNKIELMHANEPDKPILVDQNTPLLPGDIIRVKERFF